MNKRIFELRASPILIVSLSAGCRLGDDTALDSPATPSNDPATNTGHAYLLRGAAIKASLSP
jgi:hypothetical protein